VCGGREALDTLTKASANDIHFNVVIMDMAMPEMDGRTAIEMIRQIPELNVLKTIVLTPTKEPHDAESWGSTESGVYLAKPVRQSELWDTIASVVGLPGMERSVRPAREVGHGVPEAREYQSRVLLVEDNETNRELVEAILKKVGFEIETAVNGVEAIKMCERSEFDVILMDCQMPIMDGFQATAEIRKLQKGRVSTPIVALTAHAMQGDQEQCLAAGMDDYLSKPVAPEDIIEMVIKWSLHVEKNRARPLPAPREGAPDRSAPTARLKTEMTAIERLGDANFLKLKTLDYAGLLSQCAGDTELARTMMLHMRSSSTEYMTSLSCALTKKDSAEAAAIAHKLKGAAGMLCLMRIHALAEMMERDFRHGELAAADEYMAALAALYKDYNKEASQRLIHT
jgi:CheY-like chemotaxis protein